MNIGIATEGPTDFIILQHLIADVCPTANILLLHPIRAALRELGTGWMGVKNWCQEFCKRPTAILSVDQPLDILVIHADCSIAHNFAISMACPPAQPTALALREHIKADWLAGVADKFRIVIATPSRATDAWMLVSLYPTRWPRGREAIEIECDDGLDGELIRLRFARNRNGRSRKLPERYREALEKSPLNRRPEAAVFLDALPK
jgi:hypothetical protein